MPLCMYQGAYTSQSWAAQVKNPQNRIEIVGRQVCEAVGGKLVGAWYCFGDGDFASCSWRGRYQRQSNDTPHDGCPGRGRHEEGS
jgi:hypothetical protein